MPNLFPASPDAERHLVGVLIRDGLKFPADLFPSDFSEPTLQDVCYSIQQIEQDGQTADEFTVINYLRNTNFDRPDAFISGLTTDVGFASYNPAWADIVRRESILRRIGDTATKAASLAADPASDPEAIIAFTEGQLKAVQGRGKPADSGPIEMPLDALAAFDRKSDPNNMIGNRWLTRGDSMLLVSQSGVGKSSWALQFMISLAVGRPFFGIKAARPLKVVMTQAENNGGDVAEAFQDITSGMSLYPDEMALLRDNLHIYRDTESVGPEFLKRMRELVVRHAAEVILVDPLLSFCGIEVADQQQMTDFLRHGVNKILGDTKVIGIFVHHTTKPRAAKDKEGQTSADLAYAGAGASELVNWTREVGVIQRQPGDDPIFKFALTKRRSRSGMQDAAGQFANEITVRHSRTPGVIRWEYATDSDIAPTKPDSSPAKAPPRRSRDWEG